MKYAIVLAAGKGTRMQSNQNKVMHSILNKPMIGHVLDHLEEIDVEKPVVVVGYKSEQIMDYLEDRVEYATQDEQIGTADAVSKATQLEGKKGTTLVLFGDGALIQAETLETLFEAHNGFDLTIVTAQVKNPGRYSRVIRDTQGHVKKIVESNKATELESTSNEINLGVYLFNNELLYKYLPEISNDMKEELNIIDLVAIMRKNGHSIQAIRVQDESEFMGINNRVELAKANKWLQNKINKEHMLAGSSIIDPDSTFIGPDVVLQRNTIIHPNVHIYGHTLIKQNSEVRPNSWVQDAIIGANTLIESSKVVNSKIGDNTTVGPFAHIRDNSEVGNKVRIGDFVELKNAKIGDHTSAAHLSYLGNATVGEHVNIGCGVVTINYDGKNKFETHIGNHSFVGSNVSLIAPINIGQNVVVAAGSVIKDDVEDGDMAIARATQVNKKDYGKDYLTEKGKI